MPQDPFQDTAALADRDPRRRAAGQQADAERRIADLNQPLVHRASGPPTAATPTSALFHIEESATPPRAWMRVGAGWRALIFDPSLSA